jgi:CheY-like chemotaxis protein
VKKQPTPSKAKKKILIVDDNVDAAQAIVRLLSGSGHDASSVHSGADALTTLAGFYPDIIFLDIGLPGESGYDVAKTIRNFLNPCPRLVALTGYGQEEDKTRAFDAGFDDFLTKPVSIADLEKALLKVA